MALNSKMRGITANQVAVLQVAQDMPDGATIEDVMNRTRLPRNRVLGAMRSLAARGDIRYTNHRITPLRSHR